MNDISVNISIPLDDDGFVRRECPTCEAHFKWFSHDEDSSDAEVADQYYCPLCGQAAAPDQWFTSDQVELAQAALMPEALNAISDELTHTFRNSKHLTYRPGAPAVSDLPEPLHEPNDMRIVEPPCHPNEPVKVPDNHSEPIHCLICGVRFVA